MDPGDWTSIGNVAVHRAPDRGAYPYGNSLLVTGTDTILLIDPSLALAEMHETPAGIDEVVLSHVHEDHFAGVHRFGDTPISVPAEDRIGIASLSGLLTMYGMPPDVEAAWTPELLERFHYTPRPDATSYSDQDVWDLGGGVTAQAIHLPGHTRGHSGILIEPDGVLYLGDIELSGFGPYYGDTWSSLEDWGPTFDRCRSIDARWFATFHHKGIIDGRDEFHSLLGRFEAVIGQRERDLLDFLAEPRTMADIVEHRFVYRKHVDLLWVDYVEERSMGMHLAAMIRDGRVEEVASGSYRRTSGQYR